MKLGALLRYRILIVVSFTVVLVAALVGATRLGVNPNNRAFFGESDQRFAELLAFEADFGSNTSLLFGIKATPGLFEDENFSAALKWLNNETWSIDEVTRVDSIATYPFGEYSSDEVRLTTLLDQFCSAGVCRRSNDMLAPHIVGRFVTADGTAAAVIASVEIDAENSEAVSRIYLQAQDLLDQFRNRFPTYEVFLTGAVPMMQAFTDASNHDMGTLVPAAILVFVGVLWAFLGSLLMTAVLLLLGVSSILVTFGFAGWFGHIVNTATAVTPLVIFTLVIAGSMHVFLYVARETANTRSEVRAILDRAIGANTAPVLLAAVTSIIGLLSLVFVSAPPIKQLGVLSACGVAVGTILLLTVAPCVLALISKVRPSPILVASQRFLNEIARRIESGLDRPFLFAAFFIAFVLFVPLLVIDEDFVRYFGEENQFRRDSEVLTELLASPYHAEVVVDTNSTGGIYEPATVEIVGALTAFLRSDSAVANVLSIEDILGEVSRSLTGDTSLDDKDADSLAQYFLTFELALSKGQSITDFVDIDHRKVRASILFTDVSMADIRKFENRLDEWIDANLPKTTDIVLTGEGMPTAYLPSQSIREMAIGIFISLAFSSVLLGVVYQRLKVSGVVLAAIAIPVLAGFGVWGLTVGEIGMAATLVIAVTIGVVIDDSIHLLYRYKDGMNQLDLSALESAAYSFHRTGAAIFTTSVVLAMGFAVLMLSDFRMNRAFGVCSALVITLALVYNATVMPRALAWIDR
jgi:predicted RND superfamily exporter protein